MNKKLIALLSIALFGLGAGAMKPGYAAVDCGACDVSYDACLDAGRSPAMCGRVYRACLANCT